MNLATLDRSMLLLLLIVAVEGIAVIENPGSSLLSEHARFKYVVKLLQARGIRTLVVFSFCIPRPSTQSSINIFWVS